jgi:glycosyltransferase involved in cell wall biosynthesis
VRILLVNDYGFRNGGAETVILGLRDGLKARGDEVRIFAGSARSEQGFADDLCFGTESPFRILLQTANPSAVLSLKRVLESFRPDVVNLNLFLTQLSPLILPLQRDVPCVYSAHWARPVCPTGTRLLPSGEVCRERYGAVCYREGCLPLRDWVPLMAQMAMFRRWRGSIDRIVTGSEFMRRTLLENGLTGVDVIPYGMQAHAARPPLSNPPRVLFAGRLVKPKGVAVLLEAFRRVRESVPAAVLDIAGDGPDAEALRHAAGENVVFHGWLAPSGLEALYARAWVLAVPSVWEEPFGMVAPEAASRGVPSVVSDAGGLAELVVQGETGVRVPPGDPDALAQALVSLLADKEKAEAWGFQARMHSAVSLSMDVYIDRFRDLYASLL